nr:hypothetical protein [Tanacetum cinerariifolium]
MIAILEKYELNTNFHQIVDFVKASHLRYALTINPTVYVSHIRQFWSTGRIETTDEGTKILATVDGKLKTISESSIRRNLKLRDEAGISSLPDAELFENLTLMGYNILPNQKFSFQKGTPTEPHYTPSPEAQQTSPISTSSPSLPPVLTKPLPTVITTDTPQLRHYTRRARIAQSSALLTIAGEPASPIGDDSQGEACPTISSLEAEQDRENITKTSNLPRDSTHRVTFLAADEGNMQHKLTDLTELCTRLQRQQDEMASKITTQDLEISALKVRIKHLEDRDEGDDDPLGEDATIKERRLETGEEAGIERSTEKDSNDTDEMENILTSLDVASVLTSGVQVSVPPAIEVATISIPPATISVPTSSDVVPTASPIFTTATESTPYTRRKEEQMVREDQRRNEQIERDAEIDKIHAEEELQIMIDGLDRNNETVAKQLWKSSQVPDTTKKAPLKEATERVLYVSAQESRRLESKALQGDDTGGNKREKGLSLEQESAKKVKTSEEVSEEDLKAMMQLVPIEKVHVEALQVKHPIIDWEVHTKRKRSYWKIIRLRGSTTSYQFFVDLLKHFDRQDLNQLWALMKETLNIRQATSDKEKELWVELKRLYEPDVEDLLWTHTQNMMHAPVEWKLYDTCRVHHVIFKDQEMFMLVEKDYHLRKGLAIVMISYKLQMENYSQMANDLIMKIHKIANSPRQQDD